jgi:hypothetical protein
MNIKKRRFVLSLLEFFDLFGYFGAYSHYSILKRQHTAARASSGVGASRQASIIFIIIASGHAVTDKTDAQSHHIIFLIVLLNRSRH